MVCPSVPEDRPQKYVTDYPVAYAISGSSVFWLMPVPPGGRTGPMVWGFFNLPTEFAPGSPRNYGYYYSHANAIAPRVRPPKVIDIEDGLSNTFMLVEDAGRPKFYKQSWDGEINLGGQVQWGDPTNAIIIEALCRGRSAINCHNANEIYSFHPGGANFLMGDGVVRFVSQDISPRLFIALFTRMGGEVVGGDE